MEDPPEYKELEIDANLVEKIDKEISTLGIETTFRNACARVGFSQPSYGGSDSSLCARGALDTVRFLIEKRKDLLDKRYHNSYSFYETGILHACYHGHLDLVKYFTSHVNLKKECTTFQINGTCLNYILSNKDVYLNLEHRSISGNVCYYRYISISDALIQMCVIFGHYDIFIFLLDFIDISVDIRGHGYYMKDILLMKSIEHAQYNIFSYLLKNYNFTTFQEMIDLASSLGLLQYVLNLEPYIRYMNYNRILYYACRYGYRNIVEHYWSKCNLEEGIKVANDYCHHYIVYFLKSKRPRNSSKTVPVQKKRGCTIS